MIIEKFGQRIDATKNPIGAAKLALRAASGCGSKANAWSWADDAVKALSFTSDEYADRLKSILHDTSTNFPAVSAGIDYVEQL